MKSEEQTSPVPDFEQSLSELESLVQALESGDLTLEEALSTFERGIQLTRSCQTALKSAEQRVRILLDKEGDEPVEEAFDASSLE